MSTESFARVLRDLLALGDADEVSQRLGVSSRTVSSWSRGERVTTPQGVFALEEALGVEPGRLSRHLGYLPAGAQVVEAAIERTTELAAEGVGEYRRGLGREAVDLVDRVDLRRAASRGLALELMRLAVEDFESEHGRLSDAEIDAASRELRLVGHHLDAP